MYLARHSGWFLLDFQRLREAMIQRRVSFFGVGKKITPFKTYHFLLVYSIYIYIYICICVVGSV